MAARLRADDRIGLAIEMVENIYREVDRLPLNLRRRLQIPVSEVDMTAQVTKALAALDEIRDLLREQWGQEIAEEAGVSEV